MSIDIAGGIIIGAKRSELSVPEQLEDEIDFEDWADEFGMDYFSEYYDAGDNGRVYGFTIKSKWGENELDDLFKLIKEKMDEFKQLTGVDAKLIGMQDVY